MAISASLNSVDPRPVVKRISVQAGGLSTSGGNYNANSQMGGELVFSGAARSSGGYGTVSTATIVDSANIIGAVDLHLFSTSVASASDKTGVNFTDNAMVQYYLGTISFPAPTSFNNNRAISLSAIGLTYQCSETTIYGYLTTLTSHTTFNSANDITVSLITYQY